MLLHSVPWPFLFPSASCVCPVEIGFSMLSFDIEYGKIQNLSRSHAAVAFFEGRGREEDPQESQSQRWFFNLIIIRLRAKYSSNFREEISLGVFWINITLTFWQCAELRPPTLGADNCFSVVQIIYFKSLGELVI